MYIFTWTVIEGSAEENKCPKVIIKGDSCNDVTNNTQVSRFCSFRSCSVQIDALAQFDSA